MNFFIRYKNSENVFVDMNDTEDLNSIAFEMKNIRKKISAGVDSTEEGLLEGQLAILRKRKVKLLDRL